MKITGQRNARRTLFFRMLTTYILLTIATCTIVAISSLLIYKHFYAESIHESVLQNIANNHQNTAERVYDIKNDVIGNIFLLQYDAVPQILNGDYIEQNYISIRRIYDYLNQQVFENSPVVNSIHLYYKENNLLISSKYGLKFLNSHKEGIDTDWINFMLEEDLRNIWVPSRKIPLITSSNSQAESTFSYVSTYPMTQSSTKSDIMVCIDFDEDFFKQRLNSNSKGINYILNKNGELLISPLDAPGISGDMERMTDGEGYYLESVGDVHYIVSYARDPLNQWILINVHPTDSLYKTMNRVTWTIIIIYGITTLIAVCFSFLLATRFYNPLKNLMALIRTYDKEDELDSDGEFKRIGRVVNGLGGHINELQDTLDSSRTLLVAKLIRDLALKREMKKEEIDERLKFLDIHLQKSEFRFMKVDITYTDTEEIQPAHGEIIKYRLINKLNLLNDEHSDFIVTDYEDHSILVLINTDQNIEALKKTKISDLATIESVYSAELFIRIFLTDPVCELEQLCDAYQQIGDMKKMLFYFPAQQVLTPEITVPKTSDNTFDTAFLTKFEHMLYGGREEIFEELDRLIGKAVQPAYSLYEKQRVLIHIMNTIVNYMKDVSIKSKGLVDENIYGTFESFEDINMYRQWVTHVIEQVYKQHNKSLEKASHDTILKVKFYIEDHISDDLSLSLVAEKVYLSPQYLSALFKKEEGVNFSTFLQQRKMEKAKVLLVQSDFNIEEVGDRVGYHTSHYFIKKFKETTGLTPKQYRSRNLRFEPLGEKK